MKPMILAALSLACGLGIGQLAEARQDAREPASAPEVLPQVEAFAWKDLRERTEAGQQAYLEFLARSSLSCGLYRLAAGATDAQGPHALDEIYYVVRGKAGFDAGGESRAVAPGDVLFVAAGAEHRFVDIEEDLELLVVFAKAPPAPKGPR